MKVTIKGKTTDFDVKAVSKMNIDEFENFCLGLSTFKQLAPKERKSKIKETYVELKRNVEKSKGGKSVQDIPRDNKGGNGNDPRLK